MCLERGKVSRWNYIIKLKRCHNTQHSFAGHSEFCIPHIAALSPDVGYLRQGRGCGTSSPLGFLKIQLVLIHGILLTPINKPCDVRYDRSKGKVRMEWGEGNRTLCGICL